MVLSRGFRDRLFRCLRITDLDVLDLAQELEAFALLVDGPVLAGRQGATVEADFTPSGGLPVRPRASFVRSTHKER